MPEGKFAEALRLDKDGAASRQCGRPSPVCVELEESHSKMPEGMNIPLTPDAESSSRNFHKDLPVERLAPALWSADPSVTALPSALWMPPQMPPQMPCSQGPMHPTAAPSDVLLPM